MDLNTENKETQQAPPINKQKVADYFVDLYKQKGVTLSQDRALRFAEHPDLKGKIALEHKVLQYDSVPDGTKLDSLIGTFVDEPVLEKKKSSSEHDWHFGVVFCFATYKTFIGIRVSRS